MTQVIDIPLGEIYFDENFNCRGVIKPIDVVDLAKSIETNGLIQPIVVHPYKSNEPHMVEFRYRIIAGHRRFIAHKVLQLPTIKAIVNDVLDDTQARIANLVENLQRANLNILEEANALKAFLRVGLSEEYIASVTSTSRGWVQVRNMLLKLPEPVQREAAAGIINQTHIRDLYTILKNHPKGEEAVYDAVRDIKDARLRGTTRKLHLDARSERTNPKTKRVRGKDEITWLINHILDYFDENLATRVLAWAAGNITDAELFGDLENLAKEKKINYTIPKRISLEEEK